MRKLEIDMIGEWGVQTGKTPFGIEHVDNEVRTSETLQLAWGLDLCQARLQSQTLSSTPWHPHWKRNRIQEEHVGFHWQRTALHGQTALGL